MAARPRGIRPSRHPILGSARRGEYTAAMQGSQLRPSRVSSSVGLHPIVANGYPEYLYLVSVTGRCSSSWFAQKKRRDLKQQLQAKLIEHKLYIDKHGQDVPEVRNWKWSNSK